jgi:protein O-GlcNAc transferase
MQPAWDALERNDFRYAERAARAALARSPGDAEALYLLGSTLLFEGRYAEARAPLEAAAATLTRRAVRYRLGHCLLALGELPAAEQALRRETSAHPDFADAHNTLGVALINQARQDEAAVEFRAALAIAPHHVEANNNLGNVLTALGRAQEALPYLERAARARPELADAHLNLGLALKSLRRYDEAIAAFSRAVALAPDMNYALSSLVWCELLVWRWPQVAPHSAALREQVRAGKVAVTPFTLLAISDSPAELRQCAERHVRETLPPTAAARAHPAAPRERITLAYLSADYHEHATAALATRLFELHDRSRFQTIAISYGPDDASASRGRLAQAFDRFIDVRQRNDAAAARLLRELEVDIAIDLKGHTRDARLGILAERPAPLQVTYLGYPGTLAAPFIDYVIADGVVIPPGEERFFSEQVVRLPHSYQVNDATREIAKRTPSRGEAGLPDDAFVFCAFNNSYKITPAFFDVWMRLLERVPGSVLWLLDDNPSARRNLQQGARTRGIDPARLVFAGRVPHAEHLARHRLADLFVDNLPYNAHTTASDALWAGLPLITCRGGTFAGRVGASLLYAVGLPELVTQTLDEYEALALKLARDAALLGAYRERLAANRLRQPLFDTDLFRRHLEAAYVEMWQRYVRGEPPRGFTVQAL